jgi:hypothetical protein
MTDRDKIDKQLDIIEEPGYYGSLLVKSQNGKLVYYKREKTEPLSGANKKKQ